jgi:hypothetical protein
MRWALVRSAAGQLSYTSSSDEDYAGLMAPDKTGRTESRAAPLQDEIEVAYYTKELGRTLQRKLLQRQLDDLAEDSAARARHGEEPSIEPCGPPPRGDRAG